MEAGPQPQSPLRRLFLGRRPAKGIVWFALPGGATLFEAGQAADALYLVRSGRLAVLRAGEDGTQRAIGAVCPGEPVGEMALFAGAPHSAKVVALRDSEILALPREAFLLETRRRPELMAELARLMVLRSRDNAGGLGEPHVFGCVSIDPGAKARPLAERLARRLSRTGRGVAVVGAEALRRDAEWFTQLEANCDHVLLCAEADEAEWRQVCGRQVDHLYVLARGDAGPPDDEAAGRAEAAVQPNRPVDLLLLHDGASPGSRGSQAWLTAAGALGAMHVREGSERDLARLARFVTGSAVGLVLSGGGARAYAHVGVLRALDEAGCPVDSLGGASMGAIIGAGVASGWDLPELDARLREAFVRTSPVADIAFPLISMSRGLRVKARLHAAFGDREMADLELPFFAVSSNLTSGLPHVHRHGLVREALRASAALPGVLPPVVLDDEVLVDGGVLRNLPTDILRETHRGPVIGVDVALAEELEPSEVARPPSLIRWVVSGAWKKGPPVVALLIRSATVTTHREFAAAREASDVLVVPEIPEVGLQDWRSYDPAVAAGYAAAKEALSKLDGPVTELRRKTAPLPPVLEEEDASTPEAEPEPEAEDAPATGPP